MATAGALSASELTQFIWSGAVTANSAEVRAGLLSEGTEVRLAVSERASFFQPDYVPAQWVADGEANHVVRFDVTGLHPATAYYYRVEVDGQVDDGVGQFRTFPVGPASFRFTFGSCSETGSRHEVLDTIRGEQGLFHLITGDFYYADIAENDPDLFRDAYQANFDSPKWADLLLQTPVAYMWDDHDYGPNNSDKHAPGREAAWAVYRERVPHYDLPGDGPIYQSFVVGRVRFILMDLRSEKEDRKSPDSALKTMLGGDQKAWLKRELLAGQDQLIVLVSSVPWIADEKNDTWYGYQTERLEIAQFIVDNNLQDNVCMLSGDAHMLAIDNGSNNTYADAGFPVFHAAALDRRGSTKGGPYSEGTYPGGGRYGLVEVLDTGDDTITVNWFGKLADHSILTEYSFTVTLHKP